MVLGLGAAWILNALEITSASAAYLTVNEIFPIEVRAVAIAAFFAIGQVTGAVGPQVYGILINSGANRRCLTIGYLIGGGPMILGGLVEVAFGVHAERRSLKFSARPLTAISS